MKIGLLGIAAAVLSIGLCSQVSAQLKPFEFDTSYGWNLWKSPDGRFQVSLPSTPTEDARTNNLPAGGQMTSHIFTCIRPAGNYSISYGDLPSKEMAREPVNSRLDRVAQGMANGVHGRVLSQKSLVIEGHPARDAVISATFSSHTIYLYTRAIFVGNRFYQMGQGTENSLEPRNQRFFQSFHVIAARHRSPANGR